VTVGDVYVLFAPVHATERKPSPGDFRTREDVRRDVDMALFGESLPDHAEVT
jgi:hypothetical protein